MLISHRATLALALAALAFNAAAEPPPEASHQAPFAADLAGQIDRDVREAMEGLQGVQGLEALRRLEDTRQLEAMAKLGQLKAMAAVAAIQELALRDGARGLDGGGGRDHGDRDAAPTGPTIDEHRPLSADGRVYVNNVAGSVDVTTWDKNEVAITGALGSDVEKLEVSGDAANLSVIVRLPRRSHNLGDTVLKLRVPASARVELETVSADVSVDGARGPVKVNTVSGDVGLALGSPEVTVQTVSGDLKLRAPAKLTRVNSVSGDLRMNGLQGKLSVETVSGNVELEGGKFSELRLKSISGDMRLDVALADAAQITGETLSGEITMTLPSAQTGTALLKSFSGEAICDGARQVEYQNNRKREYVWGDGRGARIELSSFSGDIHIERK